MADYYHYRQKIEKQRRRRNAVVALMVVLIILCAAAGFFWMSRHNQQANTPQAEPAMPTSETAATATPEQPEPTAQTPGNPQRLLPAVDNAAWDTATPVEQTIDLEYLNTDSRMAALPALGTVERSHFDTVTFLGDSITEGMECYATGYQNAHVRAYRGAGPESVVYNTTVKDHIRNVQEPAFDAVVQTQPDALYILFGTNTLVNGSEDTATKFITYYEKMIDMFHESLPNVPIYVQSIPGVQEWVKDSKPGLQNDRIKLVNNLLANMALRKGCYFVNIAEALNQPDGSQIDEYEADGIHMQPVGYTAWCNYLATHTAWDRRNTYAGENPLYILGS